MEERVETQDIVVVVTCAMLFVLALGVGILGGLFFFSARPPTSEPTARVEVVEPTRTPRPQPTPQPTSEPDVLTLEQMEAYNLWWGGIDSAIADALERIPVTPQDWSEGEPLPWGVLEELRGIVDRMEETDPPEGLEEVHASRVRGVRCIADVVEHVLTDLERYGWGEEVRRAQEEFGTCAYSLKRAWEKFKSLYEERGGEIMEEPSEERRS